MLAGHRRTSGSVACRKIVATSQKRLKNVKLHLENCFANSQACLLAEMYRPSAGLLLRP